MAYIGASPTYGVFDRQVLTGDGTTTQFNLDHMAVPTSLLVVLDGIVQEPEHSYSTAMSGGQPKINFSEAPDNLGRTAFTLTRTPAANQAANFAVFVDNVYQRYGSSYAYTVTGSTITFTSAPPTGTNNIQVIQLNGANTLNTVADGAITSA